MKREMTGQQYLNEIEQAMDNAERFHQVECIIAYVTAGAAAIACLFMYANSFVS